MSVLRRALPFAAAAVLAASLVCDAATAQSRGGGGGAGGRAGGSGVTRPASPSTSSLLSAPAAQSLPSPSTSTPGVLATPAPQAPGIAPLSPQLSTQFSSGGVPQSSSGSGGL